MGKPSIAELSSRVRSRSALRAAGWGERSIARAVQQGALVRIAHGRMVEGAVWRECFPEQRQILRALAVAANARHPVVFGGRTAAAVLGLPLVGAGEAARNERPVLLVPRGANSDDSADAVRRSTAWSEAEVVAVHGLRVTGIERTVRDLARFDSQEQGIAAADAAVRMRAPVPRGRAPALEAREWIEAQLDALQGLRGRRGVHRAIELFRLADGRAESPLESVARLRFMRAGYAAEPQFDLDGPDGRRFYADLALLDCGVLCEVDGAVKYAEDGREALRAEKRRTDWIIATTGLRIVRMTADDVATEHAFAAWLRDHLIPAPRLWPPRSGPPRSRPPRPPPQTPSRSASTVVAADGAAPAVVAAAAVSAAERGARARPARPALEDLTSGARST